MPIGSFERDDCAPAEDMKDNLGPICKARIRSGLRGFSLLELMIVLAIIIIIAGFTVPTLMTQVYQAKIRYAATDVSSLLQRVRMEAVRKNSFYSVQYVAGSPAMARDIDKNSALVTSIPQTVFGNSVTGFFGSGSGAPGEAGFLASLNFTTAASGAGSASFNSRGLPCMASGGATCTQTLGQGFVFFFSGTNASGGNLGWAAVAVTPSGRCQVFSYDGTNWWQL